MNNPIPIICVLLAAVHVFHPRQDGFSSPDLRELQEKGREP